MPDDEKPNDDEAEKVPKASHLHGLPAGDELRRGRSINLEGGIGDNDDQNYDRIMKALKKWERSTGKVPNLRELSIETGLAVNIINGILLKFLSDDTTEGSTEFSSSLKESLGLVEVAELLIGDGLLSPKQWQEVQMVREKTGEPISVILARLGLAREHE